MIVVTIIGNGNVASHLLKAFTAVKTVQVIAVNSRKITTIPKSDVVIIAVSDDAIATVSKKITANLVVHTSGSIPMEDLQNKGRKGVFYMLQSFSKNKKVNFNTVPFCLEAQNKNDLQLLETLAKLLGKNVYFINSEQRKNLHLAAVFVNNFVNHLYKIGNDICTKNHIPFTILQPLIKETALKIEKLPPKEAQTGPAIRNDQKTINAHLKMLNAQQKELYTLLTKSILNNGKKL